MSQGDSIKDPNADRSDLANAHPERTAGELRERAARGVFWTALGNWGTQLSAFLVFALLSHLLEPRGFGLVALASVFVGLIQVIASQGMLDAIVQREEVDPEHLDSAFWLSVGFSATLAAALAGGAYPLAHGLDEPQLAPVLAVLGLGLPIASAGLVQRAILLRRLAFRDLTLRMLAASLVGGVCGVGAALAGLGVWSLVVQNLTNITAGTLIVWRVTNWRPRFRFSRRHFRDLFAFGANVVGFRVINYFNRRADDLLIGAFLGPVALGLYSVAYRVLILVLEVTSSLIDAVAFPVFSRIQREQDRLRNAYYSASSFAALMIFPAFIGLMVTAPQIVEVIFGSKWKGSVPVMRVLALFGIVQALSYFTTTMLVSLGKPQWRIGIVALTAVLNVTGFLITVRHGIVAVAVSLTVVGYLTAPISFWALNRLVAVSWRAYLARVRGPAIAAGAMAAILIGLQRPLSSAPPSVALVLLVGAGLLTYVALVYLLDRSLATQAYAMVRKLVPLRRWTVTEKSDETS